MTPAETVAGRLRKAMAAIDDCDCAPCVAYRDAAALLDAGEKLAAAARDFQPVGRLHWPWCRFTGSAIAHNFALSLEMHESGACGRDDHPSCDCGGSALIAARATYRAAVERRKR